jgi:hypothetical protein
MFPIVDGDLVFSSARYFFPWLIPNLIKPSSISVTRFVWRKVTVFFEICSSFALKYWIRMKILFFHRREPFPALPRYDSVFFIVDRFRINSQCPLATSRPADRQKRLS